MEKTENFKTWDETHQNLIVETFALILKTSKKEDLKKCFEMGNPNVTIIFGGTKQCRIENEGSGALKVLLREYFNLTL